MPRPTLRLAAPLALLAAAAPAATAGDLAPPVGPVSPTQKTIQEAEPRTPIHAADFPVTIDEPGSYYLTEDVPFLGVNGEHGITIVEDNVTIDLRGFALIGANEVAQGGTGILVSGDHEGISIRNGIVRAWGEHGIGAGDADGTIVEGVHARDNGDDGIKVGLDAIVRSCVGANNGNNGITASANSVLEVCTAAGNGADGIKTGRVGCTITACCAHDNTGDGIDTTFDVPSIGVSAPTLADCTTFGNGANGIKAGTGATVHACTSTGNSVDGINAENQVRIIDCSTSGNQGDGIEVSDNCFVSGCSTSGNGFGAPVGNGIRATGSDNRIDANSTTDNDGGVVVTGAGNIIVRNTASGNDTDYSIVAGNSVGAILDVSGADITTSNAWRNFVY